MNFYNLHTKDFVLIPARELRVDDLISLHGPGNTYGVARINYVADSQGQITVISYVLPDGAKIYSNRDITVDVEWDGKRHVIKVTALLDSHERVQILG